MTVVDERPLRNTDTPNVEVGYRLDADAVFDLLADVLQQA